jgi:hypothetical protein
MLNIDPANMTGGLLGLALMTLLLGGYGYLLLGRFVVVTRDVLFEMAGLCVLVGFLAFSWVGSLLAVASLFTWWLLLLGAAALVLAVRRWVPLSEPIALPPMPWLVQLMAVALIGGAAWLFARPTESWLVLDDSAVYGIAGVHLAEMGSLIPSLEVLMCRGHQAFRYFGPFRWWDACTRTLSIGFLPTPKVWGGIATWLFGRGGAVWSAPFSGTVALMAWFLFVRRTVGALPALVATALLAVAFPQVWYARVLMSETFTQIALFGGLYLLLVERENNATNRPGIMGVGAALLLGLLSLVRFEAVLFTVILLAAWLVSYVAMARATPLRWPVGWIPRWMGYVALATIVAMGLSFVSTPHYYLDQMVKLMARDTISLAMLAMIPMAVALAWVRRVDTQRLWGAVATRPFARILMVLLAVAWLLVTALDMSFGGGPFRGVSFWLPLYLGWAGFLLGAAGIVWFALRRTPTPEVYALLVLALFVATGFAIRPLVTRVHPWAIRRYVPFIIPAMALGIGLFYDQVWTSFARLTANRARLWRWPVGLVLALLVSLSVALFGRVTLPFVNYREMAGLWDQLEELASLYPQDAILLFDDGPFGQRMPQVMELVFGHSVISFREPVNPDLGDRLDAMVEFAHEEDRRVFLTVIDGDLMWESELYALESHAAYTIQAPRVRYERTPPPTEASIGMMAFMVDIYEVVSLDDLSLLQNASLTVPLGQGSYPYLRGVHQLETDAEGRPFRWTGDEARITVPIPTSAQPSGRVTIALDLGAWRPNEAGQTMMTVTVQGEPVLESQVEHVVAPQRFEIELDDIIRPSQTSLVIRIEAEPWYPIDYGLEDGRGLGLILYGITVTFEDVDSAL